MEKSKIKEILSTLYVPRAEGLEGKCYRSEYMMDEHEAHAIYEAVSSAAFDSGLSHGFSYEIGERACGILADLDDWDDDDSITEAVDGAVPIYTHELMKIYASNHSAVDEAVNELGDNHEDSVQNAKMAWYLEIEKMVRAIKSNIEAI